MYGGLKKYMIQEILAKIEKIPTGFIVQQALVSKTSRAGTSGVASCGERIIQNENYTCIRGSMLVISLTTLEDKCAHLRTHLLKSESESSVFMERGLVHGCISLEDNTELLIVSDSGLITIQIPPITI